MTPAIPRSAYVHVPFCVHRCGYCDFTLVANRDDLIEDFLTAIAIEIGKVDGEHVLDTLFFGGGTPTHLSPEQLQRLIEIIRKKFTFSHDIEFSVEGNPADICEKTLRVLANEGVNRVSLGVQSFDDAMLKTLERDHCREDISECVHRVQKVIPNVSLDLIFAVPGQTLELWRQTLDEAVGLQPTHLSTYGLTFEKGTDFWSRREKGELTQAEDELERAMYDQAMSVLEDADYSQYEISSFARTGFQCRHNQVYWNGEEFFGFGPGAASYQNGCRIMNHRSVRTWLKRTLAGESGVGETERLSPEDRARELLVLGLRQTQGISQPEFEKASGFRLSELGGDAAQKLVEQGLLEQDEGQLRLTREGRFLADSVAGELLT